jgi:glutamate-1-semialdehyde 2,1-aminomutase
MAILPHVGVYGSQATSATDQNIEQYKRFFHLMLDGGVYLPPSPVEAFFLSSAHTDEDIDQTIALAERSLAAVAS